MKVKFKTSLETWLRGLIETEDGGGPALNKPTLEKTLLRLDWNKTHLRTPSQVVRAPGHDTGRKGEVRKSGDLGPLWKRQDLIKDLGKGPSARCKDQKVNLVK